MVKLQLRMDAETHAAAVKAAKDDIRSLNGWLVVAVKEKLARGSGAKLVQEK